MNLLAIVATLASGMALTAAAQVPSAPAPASAAAATPSIPAGPAKIAVIAFQVVVAQTNEGQRNFADLQKKYAPKEAQLKALNDDIDKATKDLQTQGEKLSDGERAGRAKSIDDKKKQLDRQLEDLRNDGNQEMQEMYSALAQKVYDVLNTYAQQQGYTLVLDISQQQNPVLYAADATVINKQILDAYNAKSGVPAPPAGTAPAAPAPRPSAPKPSGTTPH